MKNEVGKMIKEGNQCCPDWPPGPNFQVANVRPLGYPGATAKMEAIQMTVKAPDRTVPLIVDVHGGIARQVLSQVPTCRTPDTAVNAIDAYVIKQTLAAPKRGIILPSTGAYKLGSGPGTWVFASGEEVLGVHEGYDDTDIVVHPNAAAVRLAYDDTVGDKNAVRHIVIIARDHMSTAFPVFCYTLMAALRPQIMSLGLTTFPVLNIVGPQGVGKSRLNLVYNQLYDYADSGSDGYRVHGVLNCNSTFCGIQQELAGNRGQVITLDELPLSSDKSLVNKYKKVVAETLRFAANGSDRQTAAPSRGISARCQAGMAFTSEIPLAAASDLTRMLVVPVTAPMTGGETSDRANAAGAFRAYITWLMPRLDVELNQLKNRLAALPGGETARTDTTRILLEWATELFFRFAYELNLMDKEFYSSMLRETSRVFAALLDAQERRVSQIRLPPPKGNLSWYILNAYRANEFHVVPDRKSLGSKNDMACIVEDDALCIRSEALLAHLRKQSAFYTLSKKKMTKLLFEQSVLPEYAEKKSATKRIHGKRYLSLSFEALKAAAKAY